MGWKVLGVFFSFFWLIIFFLATSISAKLLFLSSRDFYSEFGVKQRFLSCSYVLCTVRYRAVHYYERKTYSRDFLFITLPSACNFLFGGGWNRRVHKNDWTSTLKSRKPGLFFITGTVAERDVSIRLSASNTFIIAELIIFSCVGEIRRGC